ncbi:MAG: hypothetical protein RLZZ436_3059 [Planctomycetota bacterium]|jgi:hypothetical protein
MTATDELLILASYWCEGELQEAQCRRLHELLRAEDQLRSLFVRYMQLHGQLAWDCAGAPLPAAGADEDWDDNPEAWQSAALACCSDPDLALQRPIAQRRLLASRLRLPAAIAGLALVILWSVLTTVNRLPVQVTQLPAAAPVKPTVELSAPSVAQPPTEIAPEIPDPLLTPLRLPVVAGVTPAPAPAPTANQAAMSPAPTSGSDRPAAANAGSLPDDRQMVVRINDLLRQAWQDNSVTPAATANDYEWVRRVYLTISGRIPTQQEVASFVSSNAVDKRSQLVDSLLAAPDSAANLAATWTNLLIGRSNPRGVNQPALFSFLQGQFAENRPWIEIVSRLIAAEGRNDQQGETNFLLAHLNDQATPATAVTARLFLGQQVHCMQCHDHPLAQQLRQSDFWSLNAFFKNAVSGRLPAEAAGMSAPVLTLRDSAGASAGVDSSSGMTFYENRRGEQKAVLPEFSGRSIPSDAPSRRAELARILATEDGHHVARAMVNRTWAMFFGYGFTNPIDDLGPHNPPSNPELLETLTQAFADSGYDLHKLMRWIAMSEAFSLSSLPADTPDSLVDDPEEGGVPLFSHIYPRPMGPEQVYESVRTAIHSISGRPLEAAVGSDHRRRWVEQFVQAHDTDDNSESLLFESNIAQALLLMNGADLESAIPLAAAELSRTVEDPAGVTESLQRLALATLNREPTEREERAFRNRYRSLVRSLPPQTAIQTTTEDMLWAYINSSEFCSVH